MNCCDRSLPKRLLLIVPALSLLASFTLAGCVSPILDPIRVTDDDATARSASMIIRPSAMATRRSQGGVEFNYERYRGHDEQQILVDHYVQTDDGQMFGPQIVDNTADSESGRVAYNHLFKFGSYFELEPSLGITYERALVHVKSRIQESRIITTEDNDFGVGLNIVPRFRANQYFAIEGKVGLVADAGGDGSATCHVALELSPIANIALRGGYYWRIQDIDLADTQSDVEINFEGPLASVTLRF
jgi:hypothetical protein